MVTEKRPLTSEEEESILIDLDVAYALVKKYVPEFEGDFTSDALNAAFCGWLADTSPSVTEKFDSYYQSSSPLKATPYMVKMALGSAFGDLLAEKYGGNWVYITDEYGSDFAVSSARYMTFPYAITEKRILSKETGFYPVLEEVFRVQSGV